MNILTAIPLKQPKRIDDFQQEIERLIDNEEFGRLSLAETIGVLQVVIINLWHRLPKDVQ